MPDLPSRLIAFLERHGRLQPQHRPWPRYQLEREGWVLLGHSLAGNSDWLLMGLWAEDAPPVARVHMALFDEERGLFAVASLDCPEGGFRSIGWARPGAIRLERTIRDVHGLLPLDSVDDRPWLIHDPAVPYKFLPAEGHNLHHIPVGPVHAGIIEPGHFRFTCAGETVVRLEERLGYVHKGIERLLSGVTLERASKIIGRVSGDSTVAYALAFARAVEAATLTDAPPRAHHIRALMAELERIANHLGDIGAICNDAAFAFMHARCGELREDVLRTAEACFGHRLMMDRIVPGGVAVNMTDVKAARISALVTKLRQQVRRLAKVYDRVASLQDRTVGTGVLTSKLANRFAAGGFIGRASSRNFDARLQPSYPPYNEMEFGVPMLTEGDVNARVLLRFHEVESSLSLIERLLAPLPEGPVLVPVAPSEGEEREGVALIEGFRGDVLVWLRLAADGKTVLRCHPRDPSWFQWPLLEAAINGNIVPDFPLCNKSFNCSYAGHDL